MLAFAGACMGAQWQWREAAAAGDKPAAAEA